MSALPLLCNVCRRPTTACDCRRTQMYAFWPQVPMQYQTSRRPLQQISLQGSLTSSSPASRVPMAQGYHFFPPAMYDPRFQPLGIQPQPAVQQVADLQHPLNATSLSQRTPSNQHPPTLPAPRQPLSPIAETPAHANTRKRKRADGTKATTKRTRRSQAQLPGSDENENSLSVPGVGPSSLVPAVPAAQPRPIADYSPISKPRKKMESKQVATDVWYFMRPLEARERPVGPIYDPQPSREKPKSPFVGCRLCPL